MTINRKWLVASIEQKTNRGSWKTIWNYDTVSAGSGLVQSLDEETGSHIQLKLVYYFFWYVRNSNIND